MVLPFFAECQHSSLGIRIGIQIFWKINVGPLKEKPQLGKQYVFS
jgi:hypothetical protein